MKIEAETYSEMVRYVGKLLRDHFGKGPTSIYITYKQPFITIHLRDFMAPMERVLIERNEINRVEETRDLIMENILPIMKASLNEMISVEIDKLYFNWSLEDQAGMILGVMNSGDESSVPWPDEVDKEAFRQEVNLLTKKGQKTPEKTELYWLSDRTIVAKRQGILVRIEKELISNGYAEELVLTKRPMEKQLVREARLEEIMKKKIQEIFVDWDFDEDIGYIVLVTD
ncbi:Na-translocating system protein MpsC family protein [Jeotgalibacillus sp. ET6]|uniref:Na-translocating system protein MpsC family protein n=1 Tax=Jeotgalibacillus sp. ET6 TaxID=3037260 RepID=UPI002418BB7A|nr:Na-translocating system protein MpsC family protein [Jeotgalibacillus sp. ET6]MDG5471944.1 Na-translocating system protein MpsC family protein [Jeotgalibacillus sp. ET6]